MITLQYFTPQDTLQISGHYAEIISEKKMFSIYPNYQKSVFEIVNGSISLYDGNKSVIFSKEQIYGFCLVEDNILICTIK